MTNFDSIVLSRFFLSSCENYFIYGVSVTTNCESMSSQSSKLNRSSFLNAKIYFENVYDIDPSCLFTSLFQCADNFVDHYVQGMVVIVNGNDTL